MVSIFVTLSVGLALLWLIDEAVDDEQAEKLMNIQQRMSEMNRRIAVWEVGH